MVVHPVEQGNKSKKQLQYINQFSFEVVWLGDYGY